MSKITLGMVAVAAAVSITPAADAHPRLAAAGPARGSVVTTSTKALRIQFNEGIVPGFSGVEITNVVGKKQPIGEASLNPKDKKQLIVPLNASLVPGKYSVVWHAVGGDTHRVQGRYSFEVKS